jgi:hypothetical protein
MSSLEMKEIRIPSALIRERRPSVAATLLKAFLLALLIGAISFFILNALSIAGIAIVSAFSHRALDFTLAYRKVAAPGAIVMFLVGLGGALTFFFRERKKAVTR